MPKYKGLSESLDTYVTTRLSTHEAEKLQRIAAAQERYLAQLVRNILRDYLKTVTPDVYGRD